MSLSAEKVRQRPGARPPRLLRVILLAGLLLGAVAPLVADDAARTRERLEREIEERQEALDRLAEDPASGAAPILDPEAPPVDVELEMTPERRRRDQEDVTVGGSHTVRSGDTAPGMVLIGGVYEVEKDAKVMGDVTVIGGKAKVAGEIRGTLVVVGGSVQLEPDAEVEGDVVAIGGPIREHGHPEIGGQKVQIAFGDLAGLGTVFGSGISAGPGSWDGDDWRDHGGGFFDFSILEVIYRFFRLGLLLVVVFAVHLLAPGRAASVAALARAQPWRSGLIGLIAEVVFLPILLVVTVVLLVSIIGIPLALVVPPLLAIALIAFFVVGYAGVALATGGIFERRFERRYSTYGLVLLGVLLIEGWSLAGEMLFLLPGPIQFMAFLALAFGFLVQYVAWTVGLGAALGDQAERRRQSRAGLVPAPPGYAAPPGPTG